MARPGVTYQDVANAAQSLFVEGKNPTIELIRAHLGTGSSTTIAMHLKTWKTKQAEVNLLDKDNLPSELIASMQGLWARVMDEANERVSTIEKEANDQVLTLTSQLEKINLVKTTLEKEKYQLNEENNQLRNEKTALDQVLVDQQKQNAAQAAQLKTLEDQLSDNQERVIELNRLHTQAQANLEHYRQSTREQRLLEQQQYEQARQQLEKTINQLQQKLTALSEEKYTIQQQYEKLNFEFSANQEEVVKKTKQIDKMQNEIMQRHRECIELNEHRQQWEKQCHKFAQKEADATQANFELQKQLAVITQQLNALQAQFTALDDQHKLMAQKNWELGQEKAQIAGQLKQMEALVGKKLKVVG